MSYLCDSIKLPVLMPSKVGLIDKLSDNTTPLDELAELIQLDAVITTRLLKVANSPFFGMKGRIATLDEAIMVIGTSSTRAYVLADLLMGHFRQPPWSGVNLNSFWESSLATACCAQVLATRTMIPGSWAFTLGLFQRIGSLVLLAAEKDKYLPLFESNLDAQELATKEWELFSTDHASTGSELLEQWNLPASITQAVAEQYAAPVTVNPDIHIELLKCSNRISSALRADKVLAKDELPWSYLDLFKLNEDTLGQVMRMAKAQLKNLKAMIEGVADD